MGFRGTHHRTYHRIDHRRFRLLCRLLAAFWSLTTLLGALQMAACCPNPASPPTQASAAPQSPAARALGRCPMCGQTLRAGMKCRCCAKGQTTRAGQMTFCADCGSRKTHTAALPVRSDPVLLSPVQTLTPPPLEYGWRAGQASALQLVHYAPFPRPPCLR